MGNSYELKTHHPTIGTKRYGWNVIYCRHKQLVIGTPTVTGGTITALIGTSQLTGGTLANAVIGTPQITGGTITSLIGTSQITGGTVNPSVYQASGTAGATGTIDTTGTFTLIVQNGLIISIV